jgi:CBS domain containing-hemolysin-like protein
MTLMRLLERLRQARLPVALVVDECGSVDGIVSLADVMAAVIGEPPPEPGSDPEIVRREDGSWLMDGRVDMHAVRKALGAGPLRGAEADGYHTLGGFAMFALGRVPRTGTCSNVVSFDSRLRTWTGTASIACSSARAVRDKNSTPRESPFLLPFNSSSPPSRS